MVSQATSNDNLSEVRAGPHWQVVLHPNEFEADRIPSLAECWSIMERSRVGWGHPEYPIIGREEERDEGEDWIASSVDYGVQREYWRLYRSGQFVHLRGFWLERREHDAAMSAFAERHPSETSPCGHIDFNTLVRTPLEIFTFAGRLGIARALDYNPVIKIAMNGLDGRVLLTTDPWRGEPRGIHRARGDTFTHTWKPPLLDVIASPEAFSAEATLKLLAHFGCETFSEEGIRREQQRFLEDVGVRR